MFFPRPSSLIPIFFLVLIFVPACTRQPPPAKPTVQWSKVGRWSGRGNLQTESFIGSTGYLRITWETLHETKPGAGRFKLTIGSSISGRALKVAVDTQGTRRDVAYVDEDPRTFYALVESSDVDWTFAIDEGSAATIQEK